MYDALRQSLIEWNKHTDQRAKLQHTYAVVALVLLVTAGLFSLVNEQIGTQLLMITFGLAIVFFVNVATWALLDSIILSKLPKSTTRKR